MIQFKTQAYLDIKKYDLCVQRDHKHLPYGHSWYLNSVARQWDCLILNDYDAVWPLPFKKRFGIKYYYRPYAIQQLGIFSKKELSEEQITAFAVAMAEKVSFADLYLNEGQFFNDLWGQPWKLTAMPNYLVPLAKSYEQVYEGFNTNLKRKLKKLSDTKLQLFENDSAELILSLFKEERMQELKLAPEFFSNMEQVLYQLMHKGLAKVYSVYGGPNQLICGAVFVEYQGRSTFLLSANTPIGKEENAMAYLLNEYLIYHSGKFDFLDFEGSQNPGLARFYKSFGAEEHSYYRLKLNRLPWPLSLLKK